MWFVILNRGIVLRHYGEILTSAWGVFRGSTGITTTLKLRPPPARLSSHPMRFFLGGLLLLGLVSGSILPAAPTSVVREPVTPNASTEARALLRYLYEISGRQCLSGQHCAPVMGSIRLATSEKQTGYYPAVFGQDFGFSAPGTWDGINYRQQMVDEAIRRHAEGFIIVFMWHAVRPTEDEPVEFESSVQGKLTDQEWRELLTSGTRLNERWKSQVDVIAWHLRQLRDAHVPVLWRPYHEMNGAWFWWGKRPGEDNFVKLYRMLFERLVNFHKLNNLVWVFGGNEIREEVDPYDAYYPGHAYVDALATDVYKSGYARQDYEALLRLGEGRPIGLAEVGRVPSLEILRDQKAWTWFMLWGDPPGVPADRQLFKDLYKSEEVLSLDELPWTPVRHPTVHYPILR